ncbi:MAG TPA: carbohydrate binding family 9 domain-containing protein [Thermoanaerobaculia bacterium]|nr:carbohydrate binding family 9 domain-containing protein [Thermoanaerobaculia bacterium]
MTLRSGFGAVVGLWIGLGALAALTAAEAKSEATDAAAWPTAVAERPPVRLVRASGPIVVDGELSEPAWAAAPRIIDWWQTSPGDNLPAELRNVARLAFDGEFLYAAFEFDDPDPARISSQLGDHDQIGGGRISDYGGVILDPRGDGKVAQMFLANASGVKYDAISSDASGEDNSPDFFWQAAAKRTASGWQLEIAIPFSSIRYADPDPAHWGVMLYRNRPRDFRYQYFTSRLPREVNCFLCNVRPLVGLEGLPEGSHWVVAPYVTGARIESAAGGPGGRLDNRDDEATGGVDAKWLPNPDTVVDLTFQPDFSQIESDTAAITANERFAIFQPEKRPFFLESVDLLSTQLPAVYTRTITDPRWGARVTGGGEETKYTLLVGQDEGGGLVVLPGVNGSSFARQDFESTVVIGRVRQELGRSSVSLIYSGREIDGGGSNRVLGPDFEWRPNERSTVRGQLLWSASVTPDRLDLADEWDGRDLSGHALDVQWSRSDGKWDNYVEYKDIADDFRADSGFIPQVGIRAVLAEAGRTWRPTDGAVRRVRLFGVYKYKTDRDDELLERYIVPGIGLDALLNSFVRVELAQEDIRAIDRVFRRHQVRPTVEFRPGKVLSNVSVAAAFGDEIDFANDRIGKGTTWSFAADFTPGSRLRLSPLYRRRTLDVDAAPGLSGRLLTAEVARLRLVWSFNSRAWIRLIGQQIETTRRPELWTFAVARHESDFAGSAVFAYKLNWQTVLYLGYADTRALDEFDELKPADRQAFLKVSYAFRH